MILEDRAELTRLEHGLWFSEVTDDRLGQQVHHSLLESLGIEGLLSDAQAKVATLATHVRDARAAFYQTIAFLVTTLFAPLAITASFFSGSHLSREFAEKNFSLFPGGMDTSGWLFFFSIFVALALSLGVLWWLTQKLHDRQDMLRWFRRGPLDGDDTPNR